MSSGSDSDEDFVPGVPEQLSEEDSADEDTDLQFEKELEDKTTKRKAASEKKSKKHKKIKKTEVEKPQVAPAELVEPEDEKKRVDDLWAKFLDGTDTKPKTKEPVKSDTSTLDPVVKDKTISKLVDKKKDDEVVKERKIFEFAGEAIVVEDNIIKETIKLDKSKPKATLTAAASKPGVPGRSSRGSGGLSSVLGQINKKTQLSTLDKSKFDWETYKKEEGIDEEVKKMNKGKDGYLDKQDFLERADYRQYEIERDMRTSRRSNR